MILVSLLNKSICAAKFCKKLDGPQDSWRSRISDGDSIWISARDSF